MSKQVDERVVSMQFDNKQFESNVQTTMSTLDKLKAKLHLDGASKGLENVNAAAKKVDMNGLSTGIETVRTKFSALEVMGVTALANITNSAVNAGKRMVSALTIDPIKTGFQEYETQMGAIQTILANTQSKGSTLDDVNSALDELNKYADQTIYNFTEMTRNIGTFTAAGVDLDTSVSAIKGIANLAAVSGSTSQQASTAMYQLSQALASGTVKLQDWNSVVNAGMGGEVFQNALKRTAKVMGTDVDALIKKYGSFRESLTRGEWLTTDVLTETLNQFTMAAEEGTEQWETYKKSLKEKGYTDKQATEILKMANTATGAATEVKTLTQLWDVMKESAQSGWAQTWKIIVGDFEEAKALLSPLADFFTGVIESISDARNTLLGGALDLGSVWSGISEKLENSGLGKIKKVAESVEKATDKVAKFQKVVNKVWRGDYKNSDTGRFELLEKAGYDHRVVQDLVNKGNGYKLTVEDIEASHKKFGLTMEKSTKNTKEATAAIELLSDEELKNAGLTDAEIKLYRDLAEESEKTGKSIGELVDEMSKKDGRTLLIESLKNAGSGLIGIFKALKNAWSEIFPAPSVVQLYNIIKAVNTFSEKLRLTDKKTGELTDTAKKLQRTFKGVFAIIDIIATIAGGAFKIAFKALTQILGMFDMDILDLTAIIGDAIVKFRDWLDSVLDFTAVFEFLAPYVKMAGEAISEWFNSIKNSEVIKNLTDGLKNAGESIRKWLSGIKDAENIPEYLIQGFINGVKAGIGMIASAIGELATAILEKFREVLGIHSPSTETKEDGKNFVNGFIEGVKSTASTAWEAIKIFGKKCIEVFKNLNLAKILAAVTGVAIAIVITKIGLSIAKVIGGLGSMFDGIGDIFDGIADMFDGIGKYFKSKALAQKAEAVKSFAIAIGILAASVYVLAQLKTAQLWGAIGALAALAGIIVLLSFAMDKIGAEEDIDIIKFAIALIGISISLKILSSALKTLADLNWGDIARGGVAIVVLAGVLLGMTYVINKIGPSFDKAGGTLIKISLAVWLMSVVAKQVSSLDPGSMIKGGAAILSLGGVFAALVLMVKILGKSNIDGIGSLLLKISVAMLILVGVIKLISILQPGEIAKGIVAISLFAGIITGLIAATKLAGGNLKRVAATLTGIAMALGIMALVATLLSFIEPAKLFKGIVAVTALSGIIVGLIAATKLASGNVKGVATTLVAIALAIGVLGLVIALLSFMSVESLAKGIIAVGALAAIMSGMIVATRGAQDCKGNLFVMTVAIGVMAAAIAALSMIDGTKLTGATMALSVVMGMFALIIKAASTMQSAIGTLIVMTLAIGVMAGVLYLLSGLPIESTIGSAVALSILMGAMSVVLRMLSVIGTSFTSAFLGVVGLLLLCVPLLALVGLLALMQNIQNATANAIILGGLATVLTALLIPLTAIGVVIAATGGMALLGVIGLLAMCVPLLALIGLLALMQNIQNATANALLLTTLLTVMTGALVTLSIIGPLALIGVTAMSALTLLMVAIGGLAIGIGALMEKFPALQDFLNVGIPVMVQLAGGIGEMIGAFISGTMTQIASSLPEIGNSLSAFMVSVTPFIVGAGMIKPETLDGVKNLAAAILILTGAKLLDGLTSWLTGGTSLADFGKELALFGPYMAAYAAAVSGIDAKAVTASANAAKALSEMVTNLPNSGGVVSWFTGENDMSSFASKLIPFGKSLKEYSEAVSGIDAKAVTASANAGKALAEMASNLPNSGGVASWFAGENDISSFSSKLIPFGKSLKKYSEAVTGIDDEAVKASANAGKAIAELASSLPNSGGVAGFFAGENDLSTFAAQLIPFGKSLKKYSEAVVGINPEAISSSVTATKSLSKVAKNLPNSGGVAGFFAGENDINTFGKKIVAFGKSLKKYSEAVSGISVSAITNSATAVKNLVKAINSTASVNTSGVYSFKNAITSLGKTNIESFIKAFKGSASKLTTVGSDIINAIVKGIKSKQSTLVSTANNIVKLMNKALASKVAIFNKTSTALMIQFVKGITDNKVKVKVAIMSSLSDSINTIRGYYNSFYTVGKYLVTGFANGISANTYKAKAKAKAMAAAAASAAKKELDEHSPSKVGYEIGDYFGIAFVNAIGDNVSKAYKTSAEMAKSARSGLSDTIGKLADVVGLNIDSQPTIRPVLDLSNVTAGAGAISSMFGMTPSVDVLSNVNAINSAMNHRQNGANDDILSALKDLKNTIRNNSGNSYNINGLSYNEGSDVAEAFKAIIRAATVERRA